MTMTLNRLEAFAETAVARSRYFTRSMTPQEYRAYIRLREWLGGERKLHGAIVARYIDHLDAAIRREGNQ
jgi:hypothetical protein